ncbi:hypothetical protein Ddye_025936 [Dipteronia dyeriana]|uniref:HAT C-terminal dimerisation domain-containing protein n=1 Tax=Dipteronia dyeriana TaxID=168575 RepID=A0AAD9TLA7_9ROSI|nr:hypothetical protein Ddye_025936 [Dipteronia dyeriana]
MVVLHEYPLSMVDHFGFQRCNDGLLDRLESWTKGICSTNNAMIPIILDSLSSDSILLNGDMFHMRCSAHILNLIVKHGLDVINDSIERIRGSVSYWTASPKREERYPTLHCIARDILAIPVSTVASELAFSTGGRFVGPHRSRLHPKTIEALMCAQDWLWIEFNALERKFEASTFDDDYDDGDCLGAGLEPASSWLRREYQSCKAGYQSYVSG